MNVKSTQSRIERLIQGLSMTALVAVSEFVLAYMFLMAT